MYYHLSVVATFVDKENGTAVRAGSIFTTTDEARAKNIVRLRLATIKGVTHSKRPNTKVLIHQKFCYKIGGIETANRQIAEAFKGRPITFVFGSGDNNQIMGLSKYHDVWIDDGVEHYKADVCIMTNYDSAPEILSRISARKVYQQIHADFAAITQMAEWRSFTWRPNSRVDKVLAVSETAQKGLRDRFGVDSVVVPNILAAPPKTRPRAFLFLSRATIEKGVDRLVKLLRRFDEADKDYVLFLCSSIEQAKENDQVYLRDNPRVVTIQPTPYSRELIRGCDMLIQLSYNESYCYSVREALQLGKPCLVSDCPELKKLIRDGTNGFIYSDDMKIDRLFDELPVPRPYSEAVPDIWKDVLDGKL